SFIDGFFLISEEQKNEFYRKEDKKILDKEINKKIKKTQLAFLSIALNFPNIVKKIEPKIPQIVLDRLETHYVTFELLSIIHSQAYIRLSSHLGGEVADKLLMVIIGSIL